MSQFTSTQKEPRINSVETATLPKNGSMDTMLWVKSFFLKKKNLVIFGLRYIRGWKEEIAYPATQIDDYVKHAFREHKQEADHLANLGAEGRKITV